MKVVATAGHVDHGKSTLISALTGINPDRLKEEITREMTIDLGFAWLNLPSGEPVGIIDVPGHRDFIENMLAGVGGIDAVIFVIAADEGIMPQTREHLAILDLLKVDTGVICLTKIDRVDDPAWIEMVVNDIRNEVKNTFLENCPIIPLSAKSKSGLNELVLTLEEILNKVPPRKDYQRARLSVDRIFSLPGFGTVVTGTLNDGRLSIGNEISIIPSGLNGRIRGLQTHKQKINEVLAGSRVAINVSGIDVKDIKRGDLVTNSSSYKSSSRLDALVKVLPISTRSIKHNIEIKVFHLAAERSGRVRVLGKEEILPGEEGFVQIEFSEPIVAYINDRFIIRIPSPGETIGGGTVIQTEVTRRYKRFSQEVLEKLAILDSGTNEDRILNTIQSELVCSPLVFSTDLHISELEITNSISSLVSQGKIIELNYKEPNEKSNVFISRKNWQVLTENVIQILNEYHKKYPLRDGMNREELKSKLKLENKSFNLIYPLFINLKIFCEHNGLIFSPTHAVSFSNEQLIQIQRLESKIDKSPFSPPPSIEMRSVLGEELFNALVSNKQYIKISNDVAFRQKEYQIMKDFVIKKVTHDGTITVAEFRDYFKTSRKYALAMLEYLDSIGFTFRDGDFRKSGIINKE